MDELNARQKKKRKRNKSSYRNTLQYIHKTKKSFIITSK